MIERWRRQYIGKKAINLIAGREVDEQVLPQVNFVTQDTRKPLLWKAGDVIDALALDERQACEVLREMDDLERLKS